MTEKQTSYSAERMVDDSEMTEVDLRTSHATRQGKAKVEIRDKKGLLQSAIPDVSVPVAWTVLFLNVFVPGSGKNVLITKFCFALCYHFFARISKIIDIPLVLHLSAYILYRPF